MFPLKLTVDLNRYANENSTYSSHHFPQSLFKKTIFQQLFALDRFILLCYITHASVFIIFKLQVKSY